MVCRSSVRSPARGWTPRPWQRGPQGTVYALMLLQLWAVHAIAQSFSFTAGECSDKDAVLSAHNAYRNKHGSPPLQWDPSLSRAAGAYLRTLAPTGKCQKLDHDVNRGFQGENLANRYSSSTTCAFAVTMWYSEFKNYRYTATPFKYNFQDSPEGGASVLHFTQVVWRGSTRLGCAFAKCSNGVMMLDCRYSPAGNLRSDSSMLANVLMLGGKQVQTQVAVPAAPLVPTNCADKDSLLADINALRAAHGVAPLTWDTAAVSRAAAWLQANGCQWKYPVVQYNYAWMWLTAQGPGQNGFRCNKIATWSNPGASYAFSATPSSSNALSIYQTFTVLIWKSIKSVGCYASACASQTLPGQQQYMLQCNFVYTGKDFPNMWTDDALKRNVLPESTSAKKRQ